MRRIVFMLTLALASCGGGEDPANGDGAGGGGGNAGPCPAETVATDEVSAECEACFTRHFQTCREGGCFGADDLLDECAAEECADGTSASCDFDAGECADELEILIDCSLSENCPEFWGECVEG